MSKIIDFMRLCLIKREIPLSWGISNVVISKDTVSFEVYACKYQEEIIICEKEQKLTITLRDITRTFISAKELFYWLDNTLE